MASEIDEIVTEFLAESHENLDRLDRELVSLEERPGDRSLLASIFRTIHTIKGTSGFLGFGRLEKVSHVGEELLSRLRDGELALNQDIANGLLAMVDAIRRMLASIEAGQGEGAEDHAALIATLARLKSSDVSAPAPVAPASAAAPASPAAPVAASPPAAAPVAPAPAAAPVASTPAVPAQVAAPAVAAPPPSPAGAGAAAGGARPAAADDGLHADGADARGGVADSSIRVDVGLLDRVMNLVGELVLARNQILQYASTNEEPGFHAASQRLNMITTELQEGVMKTRMQPIGNVFGKFPRVVRDLAIACRKQVRIEIEGRETELDKTVLEAIKDPLTHLVRNAVDHGIEPVERRLARGKPAEGRLHLRAFHEGGQVNIELADDGGGVDVEAVRRRGLERGLITPERAASMSEHELLGLIFLPGFSTAQSVTNVSGRGVGMDVVKTNVEKIGGTIDIQTRPGAGTSFRIRIPLTLAIIPALIVTSRGDRYAIPQVSLLELVRLDEAQARAGLETIHSTPVYRLRGNLLPIVHLDRELWPAAAQPEAPRESVNIVVLQADGRSFGLVVDEVNDTEEIVVKPLGPQLDGIAAFSGATIMGDGKIALILDVLGIAQRANVVGAGRERAAAVRAEKGSEREAERQALLLVNARDDGRVAIPLSAVARLEEFRSTDLERVGGREVVQYRGEILPLVRLSDALGERRKAPRTASEDQVRESIHVVVYGQGDGKVGLVVERIVDIVEEVVDLRRGGTRAGVLGCAVIQGRITELLDVDGILEAARGHGVRRRAEA